MTTALYRISSNEVLDISATDRQFNEELDSFKAVLTDPTLTDGGDVRDPSGDYRVFGYAKLNSNGTIRNATQEEIDTFVYAQADDLNQAEADKAKAYFQNHPQFRRIMIAFADLVRGQINILRKWTRDYKTAVASATSLADLQTKVDTLPVLVDKELAELKTAILNRIDRDD